ncbi:MULTISPECIES: DUF6655 family protein [Phenylobacterium]|uniref:Uncharacterized protein n=1 Tax=Phenylobacterium koreense TaxID=266125 RepID=A0ABV2EEB7_9CAUL
MVAIFRWSSALSGLLAGAFLLSGCATPVETRPGRTATEQLLVSHAAERAAKQLTLPIPAGASVFLDTANFRGEGADYAQSAIREGLVSRGARLSPTREGADIIVEIRMGVLSIDQISRVLGIPSIQVPISPQWTVVTIPELSIYSRNDRSGVAEFSAFAYERKSGKPIAVEVRASGTTTMRSHKLMMVLPWGQQEVRPGDSALDSEPWWKLW